MAKVKLNPPQWVTVAAGDLSIDLLLHRLGEFEAIEVGELMSQARQTLRIEYVLDAKGNPMLGPNGAQLERSREMTTIPEVGSVSRGMRYLYERVIRGWRGVTDDAGKPLQYSMETLEQLTAQYPEWADALREKVGEFSGMKLEGPVRPQKATSSEPGSPSETDGSAESPESPTS